VTASATMQVIVEALPSLWSIW